MSRWMKFPKEALFQQELSEESLSGEGNSDKMEEEDPREQTEKASEKPQIPSKSERDEELELLRLTVREQGQALTAAQQRANQQQTYQPEKKEESQTPFKDPDSTEFFTDPGKSTRKIIEDVLQGQLEKIIAPFVADRESLRAMAVWDDLVQREDDALDYKPLIESLLVKNGIQNPTVDTLHSLYYMAAGLAAKGKGEKVSSNGSKREESEDPREQKEKPTRMSPQHRPSSQPLPKSTSSKAPQRELTESEKKLARMYKMTDAEYLAEQIASSDSIVD